MIPFCSDTWWKVDPASVENAVRNMVAWSIVYGDNKGEKDKRDEWGEKKASERIFYISIEKYFCGSIITMFANEYRLTERGFYANGISVF